MGSRKVKLPLPNGVCLECLQNPDLTGYTDFIQVTYCTHHQAGAYMLLDANPENRRWTVFVPISLNEWVEVVASIMKFLEQNKEDKYWRKTLDFNGILH